MTPRPTTIDLPEDIWFIIAAYSQRSQLQHLRSVNRCFLNIAMDARYRHVDLVRDFTLGYTFWILHRLKDPYVAHRVRSLAIGMTFLQRVLLPQPQHTLSSQTSPEALPAGAFKSVGTTISRHLSSFIFKPIRKPPQHQHQPQAISFAELLATMAVLPNVIKYEIDSWLPAPQSTRPFYAAAWTSLGHNLLSLKLHVQLELLRDILTPVPKLPQLEELKYTLSKAFLETDETPILEGVLAPFINCHSQSLISLALITYDSSDYTPLLQALHHLPALSKLVVRHPFLDMNRTDLSGLHHMFILHSSRLRDLQLHIYFPVAEHSDSVSGQVFSTLPHWHVPLPELRRLSLTLESRRDRLPSLLPYLGFVSRNLASLALGDHSFSPKNVTSLLCSISHQSGESNTGHTSLKSLSITIQYLRPSALDVFASYLPELESLILRFDELLIDPRDQRTDSSLPPTFLRQMAHKLYPSWKLRRLALLSTSLISPTTRAHIRAFARAIPNLEVINGKTRAEVEREVDS